MILDLLMAAAGGAVSDSSIVGTSSKKLTSNASSMGVLCPPGTAVGDMMLMVAVGNAVTPQTPFGWTPVYNSSQLLVCYKIATSSDIAGTTYTLSLGASQLATACVISHKHPTTSATPAIGSIVSGVSGDSTITTSSVSISTAPALIFSVFYQFTGTSCTFSVPPGTDVVSDQGGAVVALSIFYSLQSATGASALTTSTTSNTSTARRCVQVASPI